jgi:predicted RND superfamily exporter protein
VNRKQRLLLEIERFSRRRYGLVFLVSFLSLVAASWLGSRLKLESDFLQLIPHGNRQVDTFRDALRDFGSIDYLMVLLKTEEADRIDDLEDFADLYVEKLQAMPDLVESVEYRFQPEKEFLDLFSANAFLFLPPSELPEMERKLSDAEIERQVRENRLSLASPTATITGGLFVHDPLGLMPFFAQRLFGTRGALKVDLSDGYYVSRDRKALLVLVKPRRPSQDIDFDRRLLDAAQAAERETREELESDGGGSAAVVAAYAGNHAVVLEEAGLIKQTVVWNGLISFFAITGLYWLCYRRFAALLYSTVPLVVGQALTFALAYFALGSLNSSSAALPALLMGLGTDFTIVMYARYVEERKGGASLADATEAMVGETGLGVFTGVITSSGTFLAMCISGFRGLRDLGFLIGTGILLCGVCILFLLPAMITWNDGVRKRNRDPLLKLHLQSFGLERLIPFSARHRVPVVVTVLVLSVAGGYLASRLEFDDSLSSLRSNRSHSAKVQTEIQERFGASLSYMMAISEGKDVAEAEALAQKVESRLAPFLADGTVGSYDSILTYLPPSSEQQKIIAAPSDGRDGAFDPARIRGSLVRALETNGFRQEPFAEYLDRLETMLSPTRPLTLADLEQKGLGQLVDRYVHRSEESVRIVTYLFPTDPRWKRVPPPGLVETLAGTDSGIVVTGTNVAGLALRELFTSDAMKAVALGLVLVLILLLVDFRSVRLTAIAMAQLLTGVLMMLGLMKLFGVTVNYANAFVATMIMGVGIDYSIHIVHRLQLSGGKMEDGLLETGKAVVMAALTNVAGFGTLALGTYPAMRSLGAVALMGSVTCLLTSLTLVPALMVKPVEPDR